jgi:LysM repeat protein
MKRRKGCIKWALIALCSLVGLVLLVLCPLAFLYGRRLEQARAEYEAPTVYITEPDSGVSMPTGDGLLLSATAVGRTPITRVELWAAGEMLETLDSEVAEGTSPIVANFTFTVPEGQTMLFVRAINAAGIIGQSAPVSVVGEPLSPGDIVNQITVEEGQTLEDIAASHETSPDTLRQLNPDLGGQQPAPGNSITVPSPEREEDDQSVSPPSVGPSVPSAPPGGTQVPMPSGPPLGSLPVLPGPILPGPLLPSPGTHITITVPSAPWPVIAGIIPQLAIPVFTPPDAPTNLQGSVENCKVRLRWTDNASDELRYDLWMATMGGSKRLIASLQPAAGGAVWVEFAAPRTGGVSFWVEAVNAVGTQPSNTVWLEIDPKCPTTAPDRLQVEVQDMTVRGGYEKAYCYVSLENTREVRMPEDDSDFVRVQADRGDLTARPAAGRSWALPIPADGSLEISGECWGWSGDDLRELGTFADRYPRETWDGSRRPLAGQNYEIGVIVQALGGEETRVTYSYEDPSIPAPFNLREEKIGSEPSRDYYPKQWEQWFTTRRLRWDWTGSQQVTGFTIFLNGVEYKSVYGASVRDATVTLPSGYDQRIRWQVAADVGEVQSPLSQELAYNLPKSQAYIQVKFDTIRWLYTCDGCCCGDCSTCEAYGWLILRMGGLESFKHCAGLGDTNSVKCGTDYSFAQVCKGGFLSGDSPDVLIFPFDKDSKNFTVEIWVHIYDDDGWSSGSDTIADYRIYHTFSSLQQAQSVLGCGKQFQERDTSKDGSSGMRYTLTVFPNSCTQEPTYLPQDWTKGGWYW